MNNSIFVTNMENVRKHRDITAVTAERRRDYLVSKPNYHTTKFFTGHLLVIEYTSGFRTFNTKMMKFFGLRAKTYNYLDDGSVDKKSKRHKKVCHTKKINLKIIKTV